VWNVTLQAISANLRHTRKHEGRQGTATSKNIPVETRLMAMATSHAEATYAPRRVHLVRIASPTIISMTPTMRMKVCPLTGKSFKARGLMYPGPVGQ